MFVPSQKNAPQNLRGTKFTQLISEGLPIPAPCRLHFLRILQSS